MKLDRRFVKAALPALLLAGCDTTEMMRHRPTGDPYVTGSMSRYYEPMITNAAAHDMTVADIHFVPHTTKLNDLGIKRVHRLLGHLEKFGGTVRYETASTDEQQIDARLASVRELVAESGIEMSTVTIAAMRSGGRGMTAEDAIRAKDKALEVETQGVSTIGLAGSTGS